MASTPRAPPPPEHGTPPTKRPASPSSAEPARKRVAAQAFDWPTEKRSWKTRAGIGSVGVYVDSRRSKVRFYVKYTTQLRIGGKRVQNKHGVFETAQEACAKAKWLAEQSIDVLVLTGAQTNELYRTWSGES